MYSTYKIYSVYRIFKMYSAYSKYKMYTVYTPGVQHSWGVQGAADPDGGKAQGDETGDYILYILYILYWMYTLYSRITTGKRIGLGNAYQFSYFSGSSLCNYHFYFTK